MSSFVKVRPLFSPQILVLVGFVLFTVISVQTGNAQEIVKADLNFSVEQTVVRLKGTEFQSTNYFIYIDKIAFSRTELSRIFSSLPNAEIGFVYAIVSTDKMYLALKSQSMKAKVEVASEVSRRRMQDINENSFGTGSALYAEYFRTDAREYFIYTPHSGRPERSKVTIRDSREMTSTREFLISAIKDGYLVGVDWYLNRSNDVNFFNSEELTPLMLAILYQHGEIVRRLLAVEADVHAKNSFSVNGLMMASAGGNTEIVKNLVEKGAKINDKDEQGRTALMAAALSCNTAVAAFLIKMGAETTAKDSNGRELASYSCDNVEMRRILSRPNKQRD